MAENKLTVGFDEDGEEATLTVSGPKDTVAFIAELVVGMLDSMMSNGNEELKEVGDE